MVYQFIFKYHVCNRKKRTLESVQVKEKETSATIQLFGVTIQVEEYFFEDPEKSFSTRILSAKGTGKLVVQKVLIKSFKQVSQRWQGARELCQKA